MADFRNPAGATATAPHSNAEELLRPLVTCGICMELYVDPVALLDCLHLACGSCAKEWLERSATCHQCRERVRGTRDSHHTAAIVEAFQSIAPNSSLVNARTSEEISSMRERYRSGRGVVARAEQNRSPSPSPERVQLRVRPSIVPPSGVILPGTNELTPSSGDVFSEGAGGVETALSVTQIMVLDMSVLNHVPRQLLELSDIQYHSGTPLAPSVPEYCRFEMISPTPNVSFVAKLVAQNWVNDAKNLEQIALPNFRHPCTDVSFPEGWGLPLTHAFGSSHYERGLFATYARQRDWDIQQLFRQVLSFHGSSLQRANWQGRPFAPSGQNNVNLEDMVCLNCASDLVEANLFEWWISKRPESGLPFDILSRPDCEHGVECGIVRLERDHARAFNHICRPTTQMDDRHHHGDAPERGNRHVANSTDLDRNFPSFGPSSLIFRDKGKEPVFLCSSVCQGGSTIPGKVTLWHDSPVSVYYGVSGTERTHGGVVQILLDTRNMHWVRTSNGIIPAGCRPVSGGLLADQPLFHCAVWWRGQRIPGYTARNMNHAAITWHGSEWYFRDQYELLCWD